MAKKGSLREKNYLKNIIEKIENPVISPPENSEVLERSDNMIDKDKVGGYSQWAKHSGGKFSPTMPTATKLDPGFYELGQGHEIGVYFEKKKMTLDELYYLPSEELQDMIEDIEKFWKRKDKYKQYNFIHKRGILLYGEPGNGKSGIIQLCTKYLIEEMQGIVINISTGDHLEFYQQIIGPFREIEPETPLIVIFEDIDGIAGEGIWTTSMLLNLLDGIKQIDNVVYLATTNYPEKLEERITNRPSRFDRRYEVTMPSVDVREVYIKNKLSEEELQEIDLKRWVRQTEGMSLSHLRELVVSVCAMGNTFEETISRLNGLKVKPRIKSKNKPVGFKTEEE